MRRNHLGWCTAALLVAACASAVAFVAFGRLRFDGTDFAANVYVATRAVLVAVDPYDAPSLDAVWRVACPGTPIFPFGYPPWYVLTTLWLGLLPVDAAGRAWLLANLAMAFGMAGILTRRLSTAARLISLCATALYVPMFGLLRVGQYTLPTALGAALLVHCTRGGSALAGGAGLVLLAFKPHVGGFVALTALPFLLRNNRRALLVGVAIGASLAAGSFVVSRSWPTSYPTSALLLLQDPRNAACDTCSSLVSVLARNTSWSPVALTIVAVVLVAALAYRQAPPAQVGFGVIAAMLASPYLRNYDYVVLLVPMLMAWDGLGLPWRVVLGVAWAAPSVALFTERATGVHALWVSALLVATVMVGGLARSDRRTRGVVAST